MEIRARMGTPETMTRAREQAVEIEREFSSNTSDGDNIKDEPKVRFSKDTRRVNLIESDPNKVICAHCRKEGHGAVNCFSLARQLSQNRGNNYNRRRPDSGDFS